MVKVSVIIPVYNAEKFLRRCLDSILNQTLKDIEIICVNDASPDNSLSILKEYENKYPAIIKVINLTENMRQGGARNKGLKIASGEYIGFVDSDDYIENTMYEKLYLKAKADDIDVVSCGIYYVDKDYNIINKEIPKYSNIKGKLKVEDKKTLLYSLGHIWNKIFKREVLVNNNIFFPEKLFYEDYYFSALTAPFLSSFDIIDEPLYYYYQNQNSTTKVTDTNRQMDKLKVIEKLYEKFIEIKKFDEYKEELEYLYSMFCYMNAAKMCIKAYTKPNYELLYLLRKNIREQIPDYRQKKYFKNKVSKLNKFLILLNDLSPRLYVFAYKIYQFIKK